MDETEAIAVLEEQLVGEAGFVAQLHCGDGLNREGVRLARAALDELRVLWKDKPHVPKVGVLPLADFLTSLQESARQYPALEAEIWGIVGDFSDGLDALLVDNDMSEERASALVYGHLMGLPSVALALHHHERLDDQWHHELRSALDTLAQAWSGREYVPKAIVRPMLGARDLIRGHAAAYPQRQAELEAIADDLAERVKRCLS